MPGRLYTSATPHPNCFGDNPNDRIYEFDPATGQSRIFAEFSEDLCGLVSGLSFTPDGTRLRASAFWHNAIVAIDGDANMEVALDADDGIRGPGGSNNLAYDIAGNFFVANFSAPNIMRYPADGGPGTVFADLADGVTASGPIDDAPDGGLYYAPVGTRRLRHFDAAGNGVLLDMLPEGIESLSVDSIGNVYVLTSQAIYRYEQGNPSTREVLAVIPFIGAGSTIIVAPGDSFLYASVGAAIYRVGATEGEVAFLGNVQVEDPYNYGAGLAFYVPEPSTLALIVPAMVLILQRRGYSLGQNSKWR